MSDIEGQRIAVTCPRCNSQLKVEARFAGTRQQCPQCDKPFKIPGIRVDSGKAKSDLDDELDDFTQSKPKSQTHVTQPSTAPPPEAPPPEAPPVVTSTPAKDSKQWSPQLRSSDEAENQDAEVTASSKDEEEDGDLGLPTAVAPPVQQQQPHQPKIHVHSRMEMTEESGPELRIESAESIPFSGISLTCQTCGTRVAVSDKHFDRSHVPCPDCGSQVEVVMPLEPVEEKKMDPQEGPDFELEPATEAAHLDINNEQVRLVNSSETAEWKPKLSSQEKIPVVCQVCDSRLYVQESQIGKNVKCGVCGSKVKVRQPAKKQPKNRPPEPAGAEAEFKLSETFERPKYTPLNGGENPAIDYPMVTTPARTVIEPPPVVRPPDGSPPPESRPQALTHAAQNAMRRAKAEDDEQQRSVPKLPRNPMWNGVTRVAMDPEVVLRTMISCAILLIAYVGYGLAYDLYSSGGALPLALGLGIGVVTSAVGIPGLSYTICNWLAVTEDSSQGCDEIHSWPRNWQLVDQIMQAGFLVVPALVAVVPSWLLKMVVDGAGVSPYLSFLIILVAFVLIYPILQLSVMEKESVLGLVSPSVLRCVASLNSNWIVFAGQSTVIFLVGYFPLALFQQYFMRGIVAGPCHAVLAMVYFRLMGRFMWTYIDKQNRSQTIGVGKPG